MSKHFVENQSACRGIATPNQYICDKLLTGLGILSIVARFVSAHAAVFVGVFSSWNGRVVHAHAACALVQNSFVVQFRVASLGDLNLVCVLTCSVMPLQVD